MPNFPAYEPVLSDKAASFLIGLSKPKQRGVMELIARLAGFPGQPGDYSTRNAQGRDIEHLKLGRWEISYWVDDPVRELRVVEINEL